MDLVDFARCHWYRCICISYFLFALSYQTKSSIDSELYHSLTYKVYIQNIQKNDNLIKWKNSLSISDFE